MRGVCPATGSVRCASGQPLVRTPVTTLAVRRMSSAEIRVRPSCTSREKERSTKHPTSLQRLSGRSLGRLLGRSLGIGSVVFFINPSFIYHSFQSPSSNHLSFHCPSICTTRKTTNHQPTNHLPTREPIASQPNRKLQPA